MPSYRSPRAVVLTDDGVFYDGGRTHPLSERLDLDQLEHVLGGAASPRMFGKEDGVLILDRPLSAVKPPETWRFTELRAWTTFTRAHGPVVHVGLLPELEADDGRRLGPLLAGHDGPADIARRLGRYHEATGTAWRVTAGVTGCAMLRKLYTDSRPGRQPYWQYPGGSKGMRGAGPLIWRGPGQPAADMGPRWRVHVFDVNAMYLAALKNAHLAWGRLQPYTGPFDHTYAGWWEVELTDIPARLYDGKIQPPVFPARHAHKGSVGLTTPVMKYLGDLGVHPTVLTALVDGNAPALARSMAEKLSIARTELLAGDHPAVTLAVKRTYAELVGMMNRPGGSIDRGDWSATIQDLGRMNMFRRLDRAMGHGHVPFEIRTDAAYFLSDDDTAGQRLCELLGVGTGPGSFRYVKNVTAADFVAQREAAK